MGNKSKAFKACVAIKIFIKGINGKAIMPAPKTSIKARRR